MSRGLKEISIVIVRSNPLTYGTTEGRMRMLGKASRGTKGGKMERISTEFPCLPGSRIYSLTSPGYNYNFNQDWSRSICGIPVDREFPSISFPFSPPLSPSKPSPAFSFFPPSFRMSMDWIGKSRLIFPLILGSY